MITVRDLLKFKRSIDVVDNYDARCDIPFDGLIGLTPKAEKDFAIALNLPWMFGGSETAIVRCKTAKEADNVTKLFESIAGFCSDEEWDAWFYEYEFLCDTCGYEGSECPYPQEKHCELYVPIKEA